MFEEMRNLLVMEGIGLGWETEGVSTKKGLDIAFLRSPKEWSFSENNNKYETWSMEAGRKNPIKTY